jgi:uncharacterized protein YjdB
MLNAKEVALAAAAAILSLSAAGCGRRPDHIEITPRKVTIYGVGHTKDISVRLLDKKGQPMLDARFNWNSSDPSIAEGSLEGHLLARKAGHAVLTASFEKLSASVDVNVAELYTIEIVPPGLKLIGPLGTASKLEILGRTSDGRSTPAPRVSWSSETPKIVSISPEGLVTSIGEGKGKIKARLDELICETDVDVIDKQISRVDLRPEVAILHVGESEKFSVSVYDTTGLLISDASARFSTPNPDLIFVGADGRVTGLQKGTASVVASLGQKTATATVLVN